MFSFFRRKKKKEQPARPPESPIDSQPAASSKASPETDTPAVTVSENGENLPVTIYSLTTCSHCKATKKFLSDCTVKYEFIDVDLLKGEERKAILEDVKKFNPKCSFPTIIIGDKVVIGFVEKGPGGEGLFL
ncbi:MAG: glutaredoxin family protein [Desulfobacterales bacterium]